MDSSKLANLSEIISSIAIVITLIYLTVETRQNTEALHAQSRESVLSSSQAELFQWMETPRIAIAMVKSEQLSPEEQIEINVWLTAAFRAREFSWLQYQSEIIDEAQWNTELAVTTALLSSHRSRVWWNKIGRLTVSEEYAAFVDSVLKDQPPSDELWASFGNWANN